MDIFVGDVPKVKFTIHNIEGELQNADSTPTAALRVAGAFDATSVTITNIATGEYEASYTVPSWTSGSYVSLTISATVDGFADKGVVQDAIVRPGTPPVNVTQFGGSAGTFSSGRPEANASHWGGTAVASANVRADVRQFGGSNGSFTGGKPDVLCSDLATNYFGALPDGTIGESLNLIESRDITIAAAINSTEQTAQNAVDAALSAFTEASTAATQAAAANTKLNSNFVQFVSTNSGSTTITGLANSTSTAASQATAAAASAGAIEDKLPAGTIADADDANQVFVAQVSQVPVSTGRTFTLKQTPNGLIGELPITRFVGESQTFAIDFACDLPTNGRLVSVNEVTALNGTEGDIEISDAAEDLGVDRNLAKFKADLNEAGSYEIACTVSFDDGDGGGTSTGVVTLVVVEP